MCPGQCARIKESIWHWSVGHSSWQGGTADCQSNRERERINNEREAATHTGMVKYIMYEQYKTKVFYISSASSNQLNISGFIMFKEKCFLMKLFKLFKVPISSPSL